MLPDHTVLLDSAAPAPGEGTAPSLLFAHPRAVVEADRLGDVPGALGQLDAHRRAGRYVAGYAAYEAGYAIEPSAGTPPAGTGPLLWFGVYEAPEVLEAGQVSALLGAPAPFALEDVTLGVEEAAYREAVAAIKRHIRAGDVYQINYTLPLRFRLNGSASALYRAARRAQPTAYAAWVRTPSRDVLSLSPELFFRVEGEGITARPMKGTAARASLPQADRAQATSLAADPKNRAENLMIVDLLRNDLSRVAVPGSVAVPELFATEAYPSLWQMTSTVTAQLLPEVVLADLFGALFPCGSVTGAPKVRAMQVIRELETGPRGVYCGALGFAGPLDESGRGEAVFNVPIRTLEIDRESGAGQMGTGSGVVWDSDPAAEWAECRLKTRFLTRLAAEATAP